jgi:hypothetical protein
MYAAYVITEHLSRILQITIFWNLVLFTDVSEETTVSICLSSSTVKMEALFSRMSVNSYQTTWNYITDDIKFHVHCCSSWSISYTWKCFRYKFFLMYWREIRIFYHVMKFSMVLCFMKKSAIWYCCKICVCVILQQTKPTFVSPSNF